MEDSRNDAGKVTMSAVSDEELDPAVVGKAAKRAAVWSIAGVTVKSAIQVISVVVLARLLNPDDYGLFGMAMAFTALGSLFRDLGLSSASVQSKSLSVGQRSNLWWINTGVGLGLTILGMAIAPLVAIAFDEPRLTPYVQVISLNFLLNAMGAQYSVSLQRKLKYREIQIVTITSQIVSLGLCILLAATGFGVWALVVQAIASTLISLGLLVWFCRWLPQRWDRSAPLHGFMHFGFAALGYDLVLYAGNYVVNFATGRFFGTRELGALTRASQLVSTPAGFVTQPFSQLAFSALSRVQDDKDRLVRHSLLWQQAVAYPVALLLGGLIVVGPSLVPIALGEGWQRSVEFVQLVAVGTALGAVPCAAAWLFRSQGRPDVQLKYSLFMTSMRVIAVMVAAQHSIIALLLVNILFSAISWPIAYYILHRVTGVEITGLVCGVFRVFAVAGIPALVLVCIRSFMSIDIDPVPDLMIFGFAYLALSSTALVFRSVRSEVSDVINAVRTR